MNKNPNLLRAIIMDHYEYPRNKTTIQDDTYKKERITSTTCIDDIQVQIKFNENKIEDIVFDGVGCTISTASTSLMTELLLGKTIQEAKLIIEQYTNMMKQEPFDENVLQEAIAFEGVGKQANRIPCATVGWRAVSKLIEEIEE